MHEYPITNQIIKIAEEFAVANNAKAIYAVNLVVGEYSGYVAECMAMYFDVLSENTMCEGAILNIIPVIPLLMCSSCGKLFQRNGTDFSCICGGQGERTETGREFYIKSIEISEELTKL